MMLDPAIRLRSADRSRRRRSTSWRPKDFATIGFMSRRFVRQHARRCYRGATIMRWDLVRFLNWPAAGLATARIGPRARLPLRRFFGRTVTTLPRLASGILRRMPSREPPDLLIA